MKNRDDYSKSPDGRETQDIKSYREERKPNAISVFDKKKKYDIEKKEGTSRDDDITQDEENFVRKDKREKESPREQKIKKYSDTRKERFKQNDTIKIDKISTVNKMKMPASHANEKSEVKLPRSINHDDIKPFTQLPHVKTDDLSKVMDEIDRKLKLENTDEKIKKKEVGRIESSQIRRNSLEFGETTPKDESPMKRQNSLDDSSKSSREESVEKDKNEGSDRPSERRIRNKVSV